MVYICSIRHITAEVGAAVVRAAVAEELAEGHGEVGPRELAHMSKVSFFNLFFFLHFRTTKKITICNK